MGADAKFSGMYRYANGNIFAGELNIKGLPNGQGIMYNYEDGTADAGKFQQDGTMDGSGVRFTPYRDGCNEVKGDKVGKELTLDKGLDAAGLKALPERMSKSTIPSATGYQKTRASRNLAMTQYRVLGGTPVNTQSLSMYHPKV